MIAAAQRIDDRGMPGRGTLSFRVEDVSDWKPDGPVDVIISNAVLQWVPGHLELLPRWAGWLADGGWLAFQLPGNFDQPSHAILRDLAGSRSLAECAVPASSSTASRPIQASTWICWPGRAWPWTRGRRRTCTCCSGPDPVTEWYKGTGLRPVLAALQAAGGRRVRRRSTRERARAAYPAAGVRHGAAVPAGVRGRA